MPYSSFIYILFHQYSVLQCFLYRAVSSFIYILYHLYSLLQCFLYRKVEIMIYLWNPQLVVLMRQAKVRHGCLESTWFPSLLFHNSNFYGPLTNGLTYFWFWERIRQVLQSFQSPLGIIPQRVNLHGVWYPGESISPGYDNPASQSPWESYPGESVLLNLKFE